MFALVAALLFVLALIFEIAGVAVGGVLTGHHAHHRRTALRRAAPDGCSAQAGA